MPLGEPAAAPAGFLEMCERAPADCLADLHPTDRSLAEVRDWAGRARWASIFQSAGIPSAGRPNAIDILRPAADALDAPPTTAAAARRPKARTAEAMRAMKDQRRKRGSAVRPAKPSTAAPPATAVPSPAIPERVPPPRGAIADVSIAMLETVSRRFNRSIRRSSDADAYGREDLWVLPGGRRPTGDCEDYVLAKRRALIEAGVDPAALSIALARTRRGEIHAVLLVATRDGEQVLDNLSPWVLPWRAAPYEWLERQAPGEPRTWVRAAA